MTNRWRSRNSDYDEEEGGANDAPIAVLSIVVPPLLIILALAALAWFRA